MHFLQHLAAVLNWERIVAAEASRLRIAWYVFLGIALLVLVSGSIPSDGTELGQLRVILRLVESVSALAAIVLVVVLSAYFLPYEEIQNRRILATGVLPAPRWALLFGTALGVFRVAAIFLAACTGLLAFKIYLTADAETLRHVAGRTSHRADFILYEGREHVSGAVSLRPGEELRVHFRRRKPEVGAAVRVTPYARPVHSLNMAIGLADSPGKWQDGALTVLGQPAEVLVPPGTGVAVVLSVKNLSSERVSIPISEALIVEEEMPLWANMLRCLFLRWITLAYLAMAAGGFSAFLGMVPTLLVSVGIVLGGYLAPLVNTLFRLPRFQEGYVEISPWWSVVSAVGKAFGDLVHAGPGESLPLGELIVWGRHLSALWLLLNGVVLLFIGCYVFQKRELAG